LISNCGSNVNLEGGNYRFINCTVASYGTDFIAHTTPVLQLLNYYSEAGPAQTFEMNALFENCIFWGDGGTVEDEIAIDKQGSSALSATFDHVLYKAKNNIPNADFISSIKNATPRFDSIDVAKNIFNFHFKNHPESPAVNSGTPNSFPSDLDDKPRDSNPDIGCYER
jgi:hypothetical protein